ncbi:hypothetical protein [Natronincola ferrireducens]|uniref:Uncharacterized protein n=1 Tax=Natronincola ferrireducens TaxID=393762 RepID=A0A1G9IK31_9FIRM|nr:hypothetical protein [Natronincola ferrireducens]SDL25446.1 hypothetical protein SAMN05660472_02894 [Natronincola ferrireducens]
MKELLSQREKKELKRKSFYDIIQRDVEEMIELYQNNLALLKQIKDNVEAENNRDQELEVFSELIYRTEYFAYQLKSKGPKIDRPI